MTLTQQLAVDQFVAALGEPVSSEEDSAGVVSLAYGDASRGGERRVRITADGRYYCVNSAGSYTMSISYNEIGRAIRSLKFWAETTPCAEDFNEF